MNTLKKGVRSEANLHRSSSPRRKMKEPPIAKRMSVCSFEEEHNETQFVSVVVREPSSPQQPQPSLQQRQQKLAYLQTRACHMEQQHSPVKQNNFNQKILQQSNQLPIKNSTYQNYSGENNLFPKQQQPSQTKSKFLTFPRQIKHKTIEPKTSQQQQIEQQATATTQNLQQLPRHQQFNSVNASSTLPKHLPAKSTQPAWILGGDEDGDVGGRRGSNSGILVVNREVRIQSVGTLERKNKFGNKKQLSATEFIRDFNEPLITHSQQRQVGLPRTIPTPEKQQAIRPRQLLFSEDPIKFNHSGPSEFTLKKNKYKSESNLRDNKFSSTEPISQISTQSKFDLPPQLPPRNDPFKK
ncbi:hypothetical protein HELRODRAFT_160323 [Helobdella robusta]|uniref:Uncharacterized protein n=1 Tax=Helobdella robusta TaxID=6412 RepID=T1EQ37_HELRO|nr:hypothetical protein HELRODRAFT_160323 [Helobdella robusta]ESO06171.1 hypothetical protein HELRODRAFT_160323 [Helobdella robusta]